MGVKGELIVFRSLTVLLMLTGLLACAPKPDRSSSESTSNEEQPAELSELVEAVGWTEIDMAANCARSTKVDTYGHFETNRNGCYKGESGGVPLAAWNRIANAANLIAKSPDMVAEQWCVSYSDSHFKVDNAAYLVTPQGRIQLFDAWPSRACSKLANREAALELLDALSAVIKLAWFEGCPSAREWGCR
jgi:hypothetical protein